MLLQKLLTEATALEFAVSRIKANGSGSYHWYPVRNKKDSYFELGGKNFKDHFELKAYIPKIQDGQYVAYKLNGFTCSEYAITSYGIVAYPEFNVSIPEIWSIDRMIEFLENTNFKTYKPSIIEMEVPHYEIEHHLLKL